MPAAPFSRRQWLGVSTVGCGCLLASSAGFAKGGARASVPPGYTPPQPVTDLSRAPGLRSKLIEGAKGQTRSYAVILGKGDEVMSGMTAFAQREQLAAAHFTGIGAIESGLFGWFDKQHNAYRNLPLNGQAEVVSLVGDIGLVNGRPAVHIHAVVCLSDGAARGGHMLHANVWRRAARPSGVVLLAVLNSSRGGCAPRRLLSSAQMRAPMIARPEIPARPASTLRESRMTRGRSDARAETGAEKPVGLRAHTAASRRRSADADGARPREATGKSDEALRSGAEAGPMPTHQRLWTDDGEDVQDRREPS